jgi:hypothetical protein
MQLLIDALALSPALKALVSNVEMSPPSCSIASLRDWLIST